MAQETVTKALGLITQYNSLNLAKGGLQQADNAVIRRENIIENRRGYNDYGDVDNNVDQVMSYDDTVLIHHNDKVAYDNGSGTFTNYSGTYEAVTGRKMRSAQASQNLYVTTSGGIQVFTDTSGTAARDGGAPRALDGAYTLTSGASGFLANNSQVAYRSVIRVEDSNSNIIFSYPSTRLWVPNASGGAENVNLTFLIPSSVAAGDIVQIYRTESTSYTGANGDEAGDEMYLAIEHTVTSTDVTNGYITETDSLDDTLLGASLYTNPSQEGIIQANQVPPESVDLSFYKSQYMFYANTTGKQRLFFTLLSVSSLTSHTVTLAGTSYSFHASTEDASTGQAKVSSTGVTSVDIAETARSLVRVINGYASNTSVYAYYLSGSDDLPGKILIEERDIGGSAFTVQVSNAAITGNFFPNPPVSPATNAASTSVADSNPNRIFYSKLQQPEHVPELNFIDVGPKNTEIFRIAALRDSLIIIKEEGVYALRGETPQSFSVIPLDLTVRCKAPESVTVLANQVFMLSDQGVVSISDTGVAVVSRDIEPDIIELLQYTGTQTNAYGLAYESERMYLLSVPGSTTGTSNAQTYVYNVFTKSWTRWTYGIDCGIVEPSVDKIYFGKPGDDTVYQERKMLDNSDHSDADISVTFNSITSDVVNITTPTQPRINDTLKQGTTILGITSITKVGDTYDCTVEVDASIAFSAGAGTLLPSVGFDIKWLPWFGPDQSMDKRVRYGTILTDSIAANNVVSYFTCTYNSNFNTEDSSITLTTNSVNWGLAPWGSSVWGGTNETNSYSFWPPQSQAYVRILNLGVEGVKANEKISIAGYGITYDVVGERINR